MNVLGGARSYLGIVGVIDGRDITNLPAVIEPDVIQDGFTESCVISGDRVLQNMIMPILPRLTNCVMMD